LVEHLGDRAAAPAAAAGGEDAAEGVDQMVEFCGFFSLDEARQARETLRGERIASEILIRDVVADDPRTAPPEEYWLRVPIRHVRRVADLLGYEEESGATAGRGSEDGSFACSDCGRSVAEDETFCPHCGAKFEE
jgi:hypothetical protein